MNRGKTDKNLEERLLSGREVTVMTALEEIKVKGNPAYLPILFALLNSNPEFEIEKKIINILGALKMQDSVPVIAEALMEPKLHGIRKELTAACWQNGLDYRNYLHVFIDIIIEEEWETGFEAFTVIENMETFPDREKVELSIKKINSALPETEERKKYLLEETLGIIS